MTEEQTAAGTAASDGGQASLWFGAVGGGLAVIGLVAAVLMWSDMADSDIYTAVDKWLAVLAGLTLAGIGMTVAALGAVLARLGD